jgi:hypothetical protein
MDSLVAPAGYTSQRVSTLTCDQPAGSDAWAADPCCNVLLSYSQCCAPSSRLVTVPTAYQRTQHAVAECRQSECSASIAGDIKQTAFFRTLSSSSCTLASRQARRAAVAGVLAGVCPRSAARIARWLEPSLGCTP